jgi:hypothetical protein
MGTADDELWNLVNGAIWRFRRRYTRQNPMARYLIERLCGGRAKKNQLRSAVWPSEKQNTTNQIGNVMNKPRQGGSELHV